MSATRRHSVSFAAVVVLGTLGLTSAYVARLALAEPPPRAAQWRKVDDAVNKGLPKTAIQELDPIIESAMKDKAYPEAVKAIAKKIALEGTIQGNKPEERVTRMTAEIAKAPQEMVPAMEAILAHWYWHYFQQNRWRFLQRTATAAPPGEDFTTWDLPRIFREIDAHFTKALANAPALKAIPIGTYDALLEKGNLPDSYRPTLYDFLAFEALGFYASPEQAGAKAEDAFEIEAGSPALAPAAEFLKWKPETTDKDSRTLKAIQLLQDLLRFHQDDADKTAYLDADLFRLQFAYNQSVGEDKAARYKTALFAFADAHPRHELSATALYRAAQVIHDEGEYAEARKVAERAVKAFPDSRGGKLAYNLIRQIEAKEVNVQTERVWTDPLPVIRVRYRNITQVHFRLYKADWVGRLGGNRYRPEQLTEPDKAAFLARRPDAMFAADLPATADYHERTHDVPAPKDLKPGFYFLFASPDADFHTDDNPISATDVWVSDLAVVVRTEGGTPRVEGFVLKAKSGEPIAGAKVKTWSRAFNNQFAPGPVVETDKNGLFAVDTNTDGRTRQGWLLLAAHGDQELAAQQDYHGYPRPVPAPLRTGQTVLFTDRSLYRPGQTVHFKGICLRVNPEADDYTTLPNKPVTVRFLDVNGQEVAKLTAKTNDYGSFSGSFTAPRDRLTGVMTLAVGDDVPGTAQVSVEEYKRPQFLVELPAPKEPAKLGGEVKLTGKATAYTGAAVGGAKVRYRVVREVRYPPWLFDYFWWRIPPNRGAAQEIARGSAVTGPDGTFPVSFTARPDKTVPEKDEPVFRFTVTADVTDTNGETRSASRTVNVGYTALQATLSADDWQVAGKDVKLTVNTTTLDGEGQAAKGTVKVHRLQQPETVHRPDILGARPIPLPVKGAPPAAPKPDPANPKTWELGEVVATLPFTTDAAGKAELTVKLDDGAYRAVLETADKFDKPVTARQQLTVLNPEAKELRVKVPHLFAAPKWSLEPGEEFTAVWGTGYDAGRAFVEVEHRGKLLRSYWTDPGRTQAVVKQTIDEGMRGGFTVRVTYVRENRAYLESRHVDVPWTNKQLTVKWERFVSKLEPGKKETWTAVISGPDARGAVAEMVAALYDQSLDAYKPHDWMRRFGVFRQDYSNKQSQFENGAKFLGQVAGGWRVVHKQVDEMVYRSFPADITANLWGYMYFGVAGGGPGGPLDARRAMPQSAAMPPGAPPPGEAAMRSFAADRGMAKEAALQAGEKVEPTTPPRPPAPDLSQVTARTNLAETAFFFPHLVSDESGTVRMEFTMPEALTKWKFLGFAHDNQLRSGFLGGEAVTAKDLMVQPNPPRFLREGDVIEFAVKVTNQSPDRQAGTVRLTFADARTGKPVDADLGNATPDQAFDIPSKEARSFSWRITVPDGLGPITYKAVGASAKFSDGEEGGLPVLSKRVLVTESLPLPIRGEQTKSFEFKKLLESGQSDTIKSQALTVQMTSNPAWYAVMALPYLMEYPYECSEQTFNRLYANALARHIAASDPKIRKVFDQWKNTPALDSPLEKNQDLKSAILEETPWVRAARDESQARRNVGILFDENRLTDETGRVARKLADMQLADGSWPWFPGGRGNDYITLYIATGYGRLRHLGVPVDVAPAVKAFGRLDAWADELYHELLKHGKPEENHLSPTVALYLYGRSFFLADRPPAQEHREAINYWLTQARNFWLKLANRQSQAHLALALKRFGFADDANGIAASIKERSVSNEELGMFWRDTERSWWWYRAPIETQAMMIELFAEVADDPKAVEDCKVWLLKQKQTQNWKTTKATADAVYALLLRGENLLKSDALVEVTLGGQKVQPDKVEAGTGFYEQKFVRGEVKPELGSVTVKKTDPGVAWGSLHWQYLEDISKVTPHEGTPLKLDKKVFKKTLTKAGPVLEEVKSPLQVGDELVVRVVLRTDRDMEYVHLKDHRGSGTEPVNVLSRYKFQDGLMYYESTKDTASHFFIDYLPKGTYVFEYSVRVQLKGKYPTGLADIQCMYAPEFNSHSESVMLEVR
jgi:uncharacterized protein YfaS (alpha-2-macroglobulin family)/tetratricopeptide (TPR) repeat protein